MIHKVVGALLLFYGGSAMNLLQIHKRMAPVEPLTTPAPVIPTPTPTTAAPTTLAPVAPDPMTPAPVMTTAHPLTAAPVTAAPVTAAPTNTPAPVTPAPTTPAPITLAPVTAAPVTAAPVTAAPVTPQPTLPAPPGYQYGAHGQLCPITPSVSQTKCLLNTDLWTDRGNEGFVDCNANDADCCMCQVIECGHNNKNLPCHTINIGAEGAYGTVVHIRGDPNGIGALINCHGVEACRFATIEATDVYALDCDGDKSCEGAIVHIVDPKPGFLLDCSGMGSCNGMTIEMDFSGPPDGYICRPSAVKQVVQMSGIQCTNDEACQGMSLSLNNNGCDTVRIENINCLETNSCNLAHFALSGDVRVRNCQCGPSCNTASGLGKCFENLDQLLCPDPASCRAQQTTITNTLNQFKFECGNIRSCEVAQFTFEYNQDPSRPRPVEHIEALVFGGEYSARGSTFTFVNAQGFEGSSQIPVILTVDRIECGGFKSCEDTTFITGSNVEIWMVICAEKACSGCVIKAHPADIGIPCDIQQAANVAFPATPAPAVPSNPLLPPTPQPTQPIYVPMPMQNGQIPQPQQNGQWVPV